MIENSSLDRFADAHEQDYRTALKEIRQGKKTSHWMWYIFPQLKDLGRSSTAKFYGIADLKEASEFMAHPVLGPHLLEISNALLAISKKSAHEIFGSPDDLKLRSSMTLFSSLTPADPVFQKVLDKYFDGQADQNTLQLL